MRKSYQLGDSVAAQYRSLHAKERIVLIHMIAFVAVVVTGFPIKTSHSEKQGGMLLVCSNGLKTNADLGVLLKKLV